jgi:exocyst complex component 4
VQVSIPPGDREYVDTYTKSVDIKQLNTLSPLSFLFVGLDSLADTVLVSSGRFVRSISDSGLRKIERNIAAIQQALRNMLSGGSRIVLSNCRRYWQLYNIGPQVGRRKDTGTTASVCIILPTADFASPQALINLIQERGPEYTFDEYNHMLTLQCKIDVRAETRATNRLSLLPGQQQNGMTSGQKTFDSDRTAYNDALIELHSFFM